MSLWVRVMDFKGVPAINDSTVKRSGRQYLIHNFGAISKSIDVRLVNKNGKTTFTIYAGMDQNNSWIKNSNDSVTLKHEQGHFDICEIYARTLRKELLKATSLQEARDLYDKISNEENLEQDIFDNENTFELGGITPQWQELIKERLKALEKYENPVVILPIYK